MLAGITHIAATPPHTYYITSHITLIKAAHDTVARSYDATAIYADYATPLLQPYDIMPLRWPGTASY